MIRLFCISFTVFASVYASVSGSYAQNSKPSAGWKKVSVCQLNFLIPKNLKNRNVKGVDSCVAEFKSDKLRLAVDYGSYGGAYRDDGSNAEFKEEFIEIDGKRAHFVTFKDARGKRKFVAGLYILIYEAQDGMKTSLKIMINVKNEEDLKIAKQIFQSLRFDVFTPFTVKP